MSAFYGHDRRKHSRPRRVFGQPKVTDRDHARDVLEAIPESAPCARAGVFVGDLADGRTVLVADRGRRFRSASPVKLLIVVDALRRRDITPWLRERMHRMLAASDDDIASVFWAADGGPAIVTRTAARIGLAHTRPPGQAGMNGNTITTAGDIARIYRYVLTELPDEQRRFGLGALGDAPRRATDGWDQYFGIPDAAGDVPGADWAVKQGWSGSGDDLVLHSTGLLGREHWRYVVVLLLSGAENAGWEPLREASTAAASAVVHHLP